MRPPTLRRLLRRIASAAVLILLAPAPGTALAAPPATAAAGLRQVTGFGSNPGSLQMYAYTPDDVPAGAPLVVALHGCAQSADAYYSHSGWPQYADLWGFDVVFPQTTSANNPLSCFGWFDPAESTRGRGEAASVAQMVEYAKQTYGSDGRRVYVTGLSAGGGMAADLLAAYPDVFAGGSVASGLPAQCATSQAAASGCQTGPQKLSPAQWGDKVRASYPGWTGPWPRVSVWQGTSDYTVHPANATALRDQWTDVWGIGQTPSRTESLPGGTTRSVYEDASGQPAVETFSVSGMGHGLAVDPGSGDGQCGSTAAYFLDTICSTYRTGLFWGLDRDTPGGEDGLPAPAGLTVTGVTDGTASLVWDAVAGAASYRVYRDGAQVAAPASPSVTDTGLGAGTAYRWTVAAVDSSGTVGAVSTAVTATTTGGTVPARCVEATNYAHVTAGRARTSGGYVYANGSGQNMGLYNVFVTHTLRESPTGHFVIADSGCQAGSS